MPWLSRRGLDNLLTDLEEARAQVWELSSEVIDARIDNDNLRRKIEEYDAFLGALHKVRRGHVGPLS